MNRSVAEAQSKGDKYRSMSLAYQPVVAISSSKPDLHCNEVAKKKTFPKNYSGPLTWDEYKRQRSKHPGPRWFINCLWTQHSDGLFYPSPIPDHTKPHQEPIQQNPYDAPWAGAFSADAPEWLARYAQEQVPTTAERKLHDRLRQSLEDTGITILSQFPVDKYILDLFIPEKLVAIEVDGMYHYTPEQWDKDFARTTRLRKTKGIRIIRFDNEEVRQTPNAVINKILKFCGYS